MGSFATPLDQLLSLHLGRMAAGRVAPQPVQRDPFGPWLLRIRVAAPARPGAVLVELGQWLDQLAAQAPGQVDLDRARADWRLRRLALALHPAERLALLDAEALPDDAAAAQVETLDLVRFQEGWRQLLDRRQRHVLLLGGDAQAAQALAAAGLPPVTVLRVVR
jgi:hypothetical protein